MLGLLKKMFGVKPVEAAAEVPYKVETPAEPSAELKIVAELSDAIHDTDKPTKKAPAKKAPVKKPATAKKPGRSKSKA